MENLVYYISRVAEYQWWRVAVELISIGLVVYWAVDFLEGTRGERLFRGVLFVLFAGLIMLKLIGTEFGFERLEYLFQGFLIFVLILAVAGFQPEIRRGLIRIGQRGFRPGSSQQFAKTIEEIILAATELSASKTGAIIVVEKKVALGEFIETGVRIEAKVSSELLRTIFFPGTALHDMAVIIRGDRIVSSRVQLPLAEADSMSGILLGSRHRSAIGITTDTDAVCLVVSEETGIISVAQNGKLIRNITDSQLRKYLTTSIDEIAKPVNKL